MKPTLVRRDHAKCGIYAAFPISCFECRTSVIGLGQGHKIFSFLSSQQKGKTVFPLRSLRLCGEVLQKVKRVEPKWA